MPKATQRRAITTTKAFLFSDLRDYTTYVETRGDAAAARLLRDYRTLVRREVARHKGAEIKTEGDSFYVVFDSASIAVDCAVAILRKVKAHNEKAPDRALNVGVGLHAGETVGYDDQFVGSAVNVASRLASQAAAGEVLVSDTLRGLVRTGSAHTMVDRGGLQLKGVSEPIRAWLVRWDRSSEAPVGLLIPPATVRPAAAPGQFVCPVLIGRISELERVEDQLRAATEGRGQTILISGEAGVGKTAFVRETESRAIAGGFRLVAGATLESDTGLPYAPFVSAVRSGFRGLEHDRLARVLAQAAPDLAQLFPELGKTAQRADGLEQHRLSISFLRLFTTFANEAPILLVLEDLHWSDEASLALLHYLARELRDTRSVMVATYRSDEMHRRHPMLRVVANLQRERLVTAIELGRLGPDDMAELIRSTLAVQDDRISVGTEFRDAIFARSEGNPFFTEELLKALVDSGDVVRRDDVGWARTKPIEAMRIPGSVREAVRARIERLGPDAQATLSAAAVIGQRFDFELLKDVRKVGEDALEANIREFIDQQLVIETPGDEDAYAFRHALTREVAYEDLLVRERKRIHRAVAERLASDAAVEPSLLAHHLILAGEVKAALPHLLEGARRAFQADAPRDAARHVERALEIGVPETELPQVLELLAEAYSRFDQIRAAKAAEDARARYLAQGDRKGESRMLRLLSRSIWLRGSDRHRARAAAEEAIAVLDGEACVEMARAKANLAHIGGAGEQRGLDPSRTVGLAEEALALGERFGDAWAIANALITRVQGELLIPGGTSEELAPIRQAVEIATEHGFSDVAVRGYINLAQLSNDTREAWRWYEEGAEYARRHRVEEPLLTAVGVEISFLLGEWDRADALFSQIPEGTFGRRYATWLKGAILLARFGPESATPLLLETAREDAASANASVRRAAECMMAFWQTVLADRDAARDWLSRFRASLQENPGADVPVWFLLFAALYCDESDWLERCERQLRSRPRVGLGAWDNFAVVSALFARDASGAAAALAKLDELDHANGRPPNVFLILMRAREAARRGLVLGPEWRVLLDAARTQAARVRAAYWLSELDDLRAAVSP